MSKKKIVIGVGAIVLVLFIVILAIKIKRSKGKDPVEPIEVVEEVDSIEEEVVEEEEPIDEVIVDEEVDTTPFGYDNKVIGLRFNFDDSLYTKENTDEIYNKLKNYAKEGHNFEIANDKIDEMVTVVKATTGDADGVMITVGIMPFEMGEVEQADTGEQVQVSDLLKEGKIIEKLDNQVKETYGEQLINMVPSHLNDRGYLISERQVKTKEGKMVETKQAIVPVGVNAVVVTMVSDGRPLEYSKEEMFDQIITTMEVGVVHNSMENVGIEKEKEVEKAKELEKTKKETPAVTEVIEVDNKEKIKGKE